MACFSPTKRPLSSGFEGIVIPKKHHIKIESNWIEKNIFGENRIKGNPSGSHYQRAISPGL